MSHLGQASYLVSPKGDWGLVHRGAFPVRAPLGPAGARTAEWLLKPLIMQVLDRFRDGLEKILITTNVLSRGIDVEQVIHN